MMSIWYDLLVSERSIEELVKEYLLKSGGIERQEVPSAVLWEILMEERGFIVGTFKEGHVGGYEVWRAVTEIPVTSLIYFQVNKLEYERAVCAMLDVVRHILINSMADIALVALGEKLIVERKRSVLRLSQEPEFWSQSRLRSLGMENGERRTGT